MENQNPEFLSTKELVKRLKSRGLRVSDATIDNWRRDGIIPGRKLRGKRFYVWSEVLAAIDAESCPAQSA